MPILHSRSDFLAGLSAAGATGIRGMRGLLADEPPGLLPRLAAAEPPSETTKLRVYLSLSLCLAPSMWLKSSSMARGFCSPQSLIEVTVCQLSASISRGFPARATV